ncbi:MAG: hypothetical protein LUC86_06210 [Prevotellaceae bacterium]|nr:hypothetical protein [Prevotellaceae bacterium]MCD8304404.1 hypothetical protein [Prevotellaceae bacterium]
MENEEKKEKKLSKYGEWLRSDEPPLLDLSDLTEKELKAFMRQVMK